MSDAPKSAWEIALEKLEKQDRERGTGSPAPLTDAQKKEIAAARQRGQAKLAEAEILHQDQRKKAFEDPEALAKVEEEYRSERRRIEEARDRDIERIKSGKPKPAAAAEDKPAGKSKKRR